MPSKALRLGSLPKSVRDGFRSAMALSDEVVARIGQWVKAHIELVGSPEFDSSDIERAAAEFGITPADFAHAVSLLMTILVAGDEKPGEITPALLEELGFSDSEKKIRLLVPTDIPFEDIEYSRQKGLAVQSAIPTLEDIDVLCDLRAVFRRFPSASDSQSHTSKVTVLLGFEAVLVLNLELNDASGKNTPCVFQVSEKGLRNLIKTLQEGLEQIQIVRISQPSRRTATSS
jgi:hypothetical protein